MVGPQLISAYVDTVLVRPGDTVKHGQVIATLDCRNASASSRAVSMQARAIQAEQGAIAHEAARVAELKEGGFASPNEIERHAADSASKAAQLMETEARMQRATLEVNDCVLRAPFEGEIAARFVDPGAFVHPGTPVASVIDRRIVRVIGEVPEADFEVVAPARGASCAPPSRGARRRPTSRRARFIWRSTFRIPTAPFPSAPPPS
jgi:RND family efflux transporter MFP subunit